jgi:hypothetical protein
MKKLIIIALTTLFATLFCIQKANAETYSIEESSAVVDLTTTKPAVYYTAKIINNSENQLITKLTFSFPINFDSIKFKLNGISAPLSVASKTVTVDLSNIKINVKQTADIEMIIESSDLNVQLGSLTRVYIPSFDIAKNGNDYSLKIRTPKDWQKITYSSEDYRETEIGEIIQFEITTSHQILLTFGESNATLVNATWGVIDENNDISVSIPLPGSPTSSFIFSDTINTNKAYRDSFNNEYLIITSKAGFMSKGTYTGTLVKNKDKIFNITKNSHYYRGIEELGLSSDLSLKETYKQLLEKFKPEVENASFERKNVSEIIKKENQNSLDYANTLVAFYRKNNIDAEIVYGLVNFPSINKFYWHFWVAYREDSNSNWKECDPYLEDLTGLNFFNTVNPERAIWGTIGDISDVNSLGFQYLQNIDSLISFQNNIPEIEKKVDVAVDITDKIYSGYNMPIQLIVHNYGNTSIYFEEIRFENVILQVKDIGKYLIIPKGVEIIPIETAVIRNPLKSGKYTLKGKIKVNIECEREEYDFEKEAMVEVNHKRLYANAIVVFLSVNIIYFSLRIYKRKKRI